jgi:hypothetical protein
MFFTLRRKPGTEARRTRRHSPRLEALEDRTPLTLFAVSAVPDSTAEQEASASVTCSTGANEVARVSLAGEAFPAGQGVHRGAFYLGAGTDLLQIDTAPEAGQEWGDPIAVAFAYSRTSTLQNFFDYPPGNPAYVQWHGFLDAGEATGPLFDGSFSTDYITSDETHDEGLVQIDMNVGDSLVVHVRSQGEAFAAEPHYKDRVAFNADFAVNDFPGNAPAPAQVRAALVTLLARERPSGPRLGGTGWTDSPAGPAAHGPSPLDLNLPQPGRVFDGAGLGRFRHAAGQKPAVDDLTAIPFSDVPRQGPDLFGALA